MKQLEQMIGWEELENPLTGHPLRHDLERLKLNLQLLRLRFQLKKLETEEEWKNLVVGVIEHWKEKIDAQLKEWNNRTRSSGGGVTKGLRPFEQGFRAGLRRIKTEHRSRIVHGLLIRLNRFFNSKPLHFNHYVFSAVKLGPVHL